MGCSNRKNEVTEWLFMKDAPQFPHAFRNTKESRRGEKKKICLSSKAVVRSYKVALHP